jgi:hypothetical protein
MFRRQHPLAPVGHESTMVLEVEEIVWVVGRGRVRGETS